MSDTQMIFYTIGEWEKGSDTTRHSCSNFFGWMHHRSQLLLLERYSTVTGE